MKTAYFDAFSGISGDMTVGALLDLGVPLTWLKRELKKLGIDGYSISAERVKRGGISAVLFSVKVRPGQKMRDYAAIKLLLEKSALDEKPKRMALDIFRKIGEAEAKVHAQPLDRVHFHEVGAVDSIVDIVCAALGFWRLGVERFECSPIPTGGGFCDTMHGTMPVPAPATLLLLRGIPITPDATPMELTTPTGAAIAAALADKFGPMPAMRPSAVGYGAGSKLRGDRVPNLFRIVVGEPEARGRTLIVVETNIDDATPETVGHVMLKIIEAGALDAWVSPVTMKKGRQAFVVAALCGPPKAAAIRNLILEETSTLGVRQYEVERFELERKSYTVKTRYGPIRIKEALTPSGRRRRKPEYDDCRAAAQKSKKPLEEVYREALAKALGK